MLCFNDKKHVVRTLKSILELTKIPLKDLENHLLSLAHPSVRILQKQPNSKELAYDHKFRINEKFRPTEEMGVVPLLKPLPAEDDILPSSIQIKIDIMTDAAVVRILKLNKVMRHNLLVSAVIESLQKRLRLKPEMVYRRIKRLIELTYIERDKQDSAVYNYLTE